MCSRIQMTSKMWSHYITHLLLSYLFLYNINICEQTRIILKHFFSNRNIQDKIILDIYSPPNNMHNETIPMYEWANKSIEKMFRLFRNTLINLVWSLHIIWCVLTLNWSLRRLGWSRNQPAACNRLFHRVFPRPRNEDNKYTRAFVEQRCHVYIIHCAHFHFQHRSVSNLLIDALDLYTYWMRRFIASMSLWRKFSNAMLSTL